MKYQSIYSGYSIAILVIVGILVFFANAQSFAWILGSILGIMFSLSFALATAVGLLMLRFLSPAIAALFAALGFEIWLHVSLREYWAMTGITRDFVSGYIFAFIAIFMVLSLAHFFYGVFRQNNAGDQA